MALDKQIYCYSCDTSAFYESDEQYIHSRLLKLYIARSKLKKRLNGKRKNQWDGEWKVAAYNRVLKVEKKRLSEILDSRKSGDIVRQLNPAAVKDKDVVNLFESSLTRALGIKSFSLTKDIIIVNVFFFQVFENIVKNGFDYDGEHYIFLTASAGQIRTKKAVFIREAAYRRVEKRIMCGLTIDDINEQGGMNPNKF